MWNPAATFRPFPVLSCQDTSDFHIYHLPSCLILPYPTFTLVTLYYKTKLHICSASNSSLLFWMVLCVDWVVFCLFHLNSFMGDTGRQKGLWSHRLDQVGDSRCWLSAESFSSPPYSLLSFNMASTRSIPRQWSSKLQSPSPLWNPYITLLFTINGSPMPSLD